MINAQIKQSVTVACVQFLGYYFKNVLLVVLLHEPVLIRFNDPLRCYRPCGFLPPQVNWSVLIGLKTHPSGGRQVTPKVTKCTVHQSKWVHQQPRGHRHTPRLRGVRGPAHLWPGQPSLSSLHNKMFPSTLMNLFSFCKTTESCK